MLGAPDITFVGRVHFHILHPFKNYGMVNVIDTFPVSLYILGKDGLDLVIDIFCIDWRGIMTAAQALRNEFFNSVRYS